MQTCLIHQQLEYDIDNREQLEGRSRLIKASRIDLGSGQQDVQDFFTCLQINAMSWTDGYMCFTFRITHSVTCCNCSHIQSYETRGQCMMKLIFPFIQQT